VIRLAVTAIIVGAAALLLTSCTDASSTRRTLEDSGFTDIRVGGYAFFGCSKDDTFSTTFSAKNPQGRAVNGVVCCGLLKSCTVRF
jgi:hypothetical protein